MLMFGVVCVSFKKVLYGIMSKSHLVGFVTELQANSLPMASTPQTFSHILITIVQLASLGHNYTANHKTNATHAPQPRP